MLIARLITNASDYKCNLTYYAARLIRLDIHSVLSGSCHGRYQVLLLIQLLLLLLVVVIVMLLEGESLVVLGEVVAGGVVDLQRHDLVVRALHIDHIVHVAHITLRLLSRWIILNVHLFIIATLLRNNG